MTKIHSRCQGRVGRTQDLRTLLCKLHPTSYCIIRIILPRISCPSTPPATVEDQSCFFAKEPWSGQLVPASHVHLKGAANFRLQLANYDDWLEMRLQKRIGSVPKPWNLWLRNLSEASTTDSFNWWNESLSPSLPLNFKRHYHLYTPSSWKTRLAFLIASTLSSNRCVTERNWKHAVVEMRRFHQVDTLQAVAAKQL